MADAKLLRLLPSAPLVNFNGSFTTVGVTASTGGLAWLFQSDTADPITHLGFRYGVRTGTPPTYQISLQSINTGSLGIGGAQVPSGTILGGGTPASATFTPPADTSWDGTFQWIALTNSYTPAKGDLLAACVEYSSGTINGSNSSSFTQSMALATHTPSWPSNATKSTTWTRSISNWPVFGYRTSSGRFGYPVSGVFNTRTANTAGHRQAAKIVLPSGSTYKVRKVRFVGWPTADSGLTWVAGIWSASGVVQSVTVDADVINGNAPFEITWPDALATLTGGTAYYVGVECSLSSSNAAVGLRCFQCASADDRNALPGGSDAIFSAFDGTNWTDDASRAPMLELLLEDVTATGGASGPSARNVFIGGGGLSA